MKRPDIYIFNPTSEMAVANGTVSWQPNRMLQKLETDLALLPAFFAEANDIVVIENKPSKEFFRLFDYLEKDFPTFCHYNDLLSLVNEGEVLPGSIKPWGWSQVIHYKYKSLVSFCSKEFKDSPISSWNNEMKKFISREFALEILNKLLTKYPAQKFLIKSELPKKCENILQIEKVHNENISSIVKLPWSSSGRGVQVINQASIHPSIKNRLQGAIKNQGFVMVEPLLDKKLDFALHYKVSANKTEYLGYSLFNTFEDGKYSGNFLKHYVPSEQTEYLNYLKSEVEELAGKIKQVLENSELKNFYEGYLGIDGLIFQRQGELKIHPCIEINLRYNMGLLAFELEKMLAKNSYGVFHQFGGKKGEFARLMKVKQKKNPAEFSGRLLVQGTLPLTEPTEQAIFGAYLEVFTV